MTLLRPYRFERELDRAFQQWLAWLPRWQPPVAPRRTPSCDLCPRFVDAFYLEDLPHGPIHWLLGAIEPLLIEQFARLSAARFPELQRDGHWQVSLNRGIVRVTSTDGYDVDDLLGGDSDAGDVAEPGQLSIRAAADARIELVRVYYGLLEDVTERVTSQKALILAALDEHVEPKIRAMADQLISEVCGV